MSTRSSPRGHLPGSRSTGSAATTSATPPPNRPAPRWSSATEPRPGGAIARRSQRSANSSIWPTRPADRPAGRHRVTTGRRGRRAPISAVTSQASPRGVEDLRPAQVSGQSVDRPLHAISATLTRSYVLFLCWSVSALVTELRIEDLSGYRHRKTAFSTEFSQLRSAATESYSNFGLTARPARCPGSTGTAVDQCRYANGKLAGHRGVVDLRSVMPQVGSFRRPRDLVGRHADG